MREYEIVVADPAKNITVFVLGAEDSRERRASIAKQIMADPSLRAEQVGFVIPPPSGEHERLWRLEMMGGEFCGNAARAFGLFVAQKLRLSGELTLPIEISGAREPLSVYINTSAGTAEVQMPLPLGDAAGEPSLSYKGQELPIVAFEGITHIIAPDIPPREDAFWEIKKIIDTGKSPDALGVMFWDSAAGSMTPAVYVYATGSLVFESSCGSGSAAMALWHNRGLLNGEARGEITQPGGIITTRVVKHGGEILSVSIGGEVKLGEPRSIFL
ncbi:MAG: hypothetical protein FWG35_05930 [Spirochaetaceae bacterium]|nr:hypothetical protein [Spirochaetaceae bacterium]